MRLFGFVLTFCFICSCGFAGDYYVDAVNGLDTNSGLYVDDAWKTITYAIPKVTGLPVEPAIIHVAAGTYNIALGEGFPITMKGNTQIIGANRENTIIDAAGSKKSVIYCEDKKNVAVENLTITKGKGTNYQGSEDSFGGGIFCYKSTIKIINCIITENSSTYSGGGVHFQSSSGEIANCIIKNNVSCWGGGLICVKDSNPIISGCIFENNEAVVVEDSGGYGGGIYCQQDLSPRIEDCTIKSNKAAKTGGGVCCSESSSVLLGCLIEDSSAPNGGGLFFDQSTSQIKNCKIINNAANITREVTCAGGGIYCNDSNLKIEDCEIKNNSAHLGAGINIYSFSSSIYRCVIENNIAEYVSGLGGGSGGGIYSYTDSTLLLRDCQIKGNNAKWGGSIFCFKASPNIINCLIANNNTNESGGGIYCYGNSSPKINSTTFAWNNSPAAESINCDVTIKPVLNNCTLWGETENQVEGLAKISYSCIKGGYDGEDNINQDPMFVAGPWGDYYLSQVSAGQNADSPCINAGSEIPIMGFNPGYYITRIDGIGDMGVVDIGYHYPMHVQFELAIDPVKEGYTSGDELILRLDLTTAPAEINADLYFIMHDADGNYWTCLSWNKNITPIATGFKLPANLDIESSPLFNFTIPSTTPPVSKTGTYTFYLGAVNPRTVDFISNIAIASFEVLE